MLPRLFMEWSQRSKETWHDWDQRMELMWNIQGATEQNAKQTLYNYLFAFIKNHHLQSKTLISIFNFQYFQVKTAPTVEKPRSPGSPRRSSRLWQRNSDYFKVDMGKKKDVKDGGQNREEEKDDPLNT